MSRPLEYFSHMTRSRGPVRMITNGTRTCTPLAYYPEPSFKKNSKREDRSLYLRFYIFSNFGPKRCLDNMIFSIRILIIRGRSELAIASVTAQHSLAHLLWGYNFTFCLIRSRIPNSYPLLYAYLSVSWTFGVSCSQLLLVL